MLIPFNKPYLIGNELEFIREAVTAKKLSGNGIFTKKCHDFFGKKYGFKKCLLTTSCTDALEMAAMLLDIMPGDEVIIPAFTFVSTANAFVLRGAKIVFADSEKDNPNLDAGKIESLITPKTKAIVVVHYAGVACDMDVVMEIASKHNLFVVEDAAQAVDSFYKGKPLGGIGHLGCFSFHETKNIISGEGGMLTINDEKFFKRAEIIWEKGTNRAAFWRGEVKKYEWVDIGSSFLPSEITSAFLFAQLECIEKIQQKRVRLWNCYREALKPLVEKEFIRLPSIPAYASNNAHMIYIVCRSNSERNGLTEFLHQKNIFAFSHYLSLNQSPFYRAQHDGRNLPNADMFTGQLLRLPMYFELSEEEAIYVAEHVNEYFLSL